MKSAKELEKYIAKYFSFYQISSYDFFSEYDDELEESVEVPLFKEDKIDEKTIERLTVRLGLSKQEILNLDDEDIFYKYYNKYPFVKLWGIFQEQKVIGSIYKKWMSAEERIANAIFGEPIIYPPVKRYDEEAVKKRMIKQLKDIDKVMPGTYHTNAEITNFSMSTENFISFPNYDAMMRSFIAMFRKAEKMFFKTLHEDLSDEEKNDLNFIANYLRISDAAMPSVIMTYENIKLYKTSYLEENLDDFTLYARVNIFRRSLFDEYGVYPWCCIEFFDDLSLIKELNRIIYRLKPDLKNYAMNVPNFCCNFVWSDAGPWVGTAEEEEEMRLTGDYIPLEERRPAITTIYVPKTKDEMFGWEPYVEKLKKLASPPSMGGLEIPKMNSLLDNIDMRFERIRKRVDAKFGR